MRIKPITSVFGEIYAFEDGRILNGRTGRFLTPRKGTDGYLCVTLTDAEKPGKKATYKVHRLVYEAFNGKIPEGKQIDHINRNREDNRVENLRAVTPRENIHNSAVYGKGRRGVYYNKQRGKWIACISILGKRHYLGIYPTEDAALFAYNTALANWQNEGVVPQDREKPGETKHCSGCDRWLTRDNFYHLPRYKRYSALCKECSCKKQKQYREKKKEQLNI